MEEEEQEELVGGLLSSLEHLFFPNNSSQDKIRNQVEKEELLGRYTSLYSSAYPGFYADLFSHSVQCF